MQPLENRLLLFGGSAALSGLIYRSYTPLEGPAIQVPVQGNKVWLDFNVNAKLDPGEPASVSDSEGRYTISGLEPADYVLRIIPAKGWQSSFTAKSARVYDAPLTTRNYPVWRMHRISGTVFNDLNMDKIRSDGEPAIAGQQVQISLRNSHSPVLINGAAKVVTDTAGHYAAYLPIQQEYAASVVEAGGYRATDSGVVSTVEGGSSVVDLGATTTGLIQGSVFADDNANRNFDDFESARSGWTVVLDANKNGKVDKGEARRTSAADGSFAFDGLSPGGYRVAVLPLAADYIATGSKAFDVVLTAGKSAKLAFGFAKYNYVSGTVYQDLNGDGRRGSGEKTAGEMNFFVDIDQDGEHDATEQSVTTDADGHYQFKSVGRIWSLIATDSGWRNSGYDTAKHPSANTYTQNLGITQRAEVAIRAYVDLNDNGKRDAHEALDYELGSACSLGVRNPKGDEGSIQAYEFADQDEIGYFGPFEPGKYEFAIFPPPGSGYSSPDDNLFITLARGEIRTLTVRLTDPYAFR